MTSLRLCTVFLLLTISVFAADTATHIAISGRDVAIWKPAGPAPSAGFPVILFSHGYGGCNTQSIFLMEALAEAGYFVIAPNHKDARCGSARNGLRAVPEAPFRKDKSWSDQTYRD